MRGIFFGIFFSWFVFPLSAGSVSFAPAVNYGTGNNPYGITVGDFNRDGKIDLVVVNRYASPPRCRFSWETGAGVVAGKQLRSGKQPVKYYRR